MENSKLKSLIIPAHRHTVINNNNTHMLQVKSMN